jgi:glycosyltransferase involved in cell wall biosynthesis
MAAAQETSRVSNGRIESATSSGAACRRVSVLICTRDRAESLRATLDSFQSCMVPDGVEAELIVIDNGSTDHTAAVVKSACVGRFELRYFFEGSKGQCRARNRGMAESTGEILIWTDDDVRVPANWIEGMIEPIVSGKADAVAGGFTTANEVREEYLRTYTEILTGPTTEDSRYLLEDPEATMVGMNMAFHRRVLQKVESFDERVGPGALGLADDTLFSLRVRDAGYRVTVHESVRVEHHLDVHRLSPEGLVKSAAAGGRSAAYLDYHWWGRSVSRFRVAMRLGKIYYQRFLVNTTCRFARHHKRDLRSDMRNAYDVAYCIQMLHETTQPKRYTRSMQATA